MRMTIRTKLILISVIPVVAVALVIGALAVAFHTKVLTQQIKDSGRNMAYSLEVAVTQPLLVNDKVSIEKIAASFSKPFCVLMDAVYRGDGELVAYAPKNQKAYQALSQEFKRLMDSGKKQQIVLFSLPEPVEFKGLKYSKVFILHKGIYGGTLGHIFMVMPTAFDTVMKTQKKLVLMTNLISILVVLVAMGFITVVGKGIADRLEELQRVAENISLGDLETPVPYKEGGDEIEQLAGALERMRVSLKSAIERLRRRK